MKVTVRVVNLLSKLNPAGQIAILLLLLSMPWLAAAQANGFDVPLKKSVVDFGRSSYYPGGNVRNKLSCYLYSTFMVKEYDEGQKGAEWLSIVPVEKEAAPTCTQSHATGEHVIQYPEWSGYFKGARGNLVFINAADGTNGGLPFAMYDSKTKTKIFQDSAYYSSMWNKKVEESPFNQPRIVTTRDGEVVLRYLRVVQAGCDLYHKEKAACWEQVKKKLELKRTQAPVCSGYTPDSSESAIAYPVEVDLSSRQRTVKTISGPVRCWPVD
jgi:hypothetical protein